MLGQKIGILENIGSGKGILKGAGDGKGPLGLGILPSIQERTSKILKR